MKDSLKYLELWQKKRGELPVDSDAQQDWLQMRSLLDLQMPVPAPKAAKWHGFKGLKFLSKLFISLSAIVAVYTVAHFLLPKKEKHRLDNKTEKSNLPRKDSFLKNLPATGGGIAVRDSLNTIKPADSTQNDVRDKKAENITDPKQTLVNGVKRVSAVAIKTPGVLDSKKQTAVAGPQKNDQLLSSNQANNKRLRSLQKNNHINGGQQVTSRLPISQGSKAHVVEHDGLNKSSKKIGGDDVSHQKQTSDITNLEGNKSESWLSALPMPPLSLNLMLPDRQPVRWADLVKTMSFEGKQQVTRQKKSRNENPTLSNLDWGILAGVNSPGSFTPKSKNANFYGSAPVDMFFGLFGNYRITDRWAVGAQIQMFSPQTIATSYNHKNESKVDSAESLKITSSRKVYNINVPVHAIYKVSDNISIKAGPVLSFPVKQINTVSTLQPAIIHTDSAYFAKVSGVINNTSYQKGFNLGFSGGVSLQYNRLVLEAVYLKSVSGYKVTSKYGTYKSNNGNLQLTIGFKLNKTKK